MFRSSGSSPDLSCITYGTLCLFLDSICHHPVLVALICNLCRCTDLPQMYYGGSNMSASPGIVPLQNSLLAEVSLLGLYCVMLVVQVWSGQSAGRVVAGSPWVLHPASPLLACPCLDVMEQGFYL